MLSVWDRVINGYGFPHLSQYHKSITIALPAPVTLTIPEPIIGEIPILPPEPEPAPEPPTILKEEPTS
jgi:hypothetical protein